MGSEGPDGIVIQLLPWKRAYECYGPWVQIRLHTHATLQTNYGEEDNYTGLPDYTTVMEARCSSH